MAMGPMEWAEFAEFYARQFSKDVDYASGIIDDWHNRARGLDLAKLKDKTLEMIEADALPKQDGARVSAIMRACLPPSAPWGTKRHEQQRVYCPECDGGGVLEVPHPRDYCHVTRWWNGEHTAAVACRCVNGEKLATRLNTPLQAIDRYELEHPDWREQKETRRLEWRIKMLTHRLEKTPNLSPSMRKHWERQVFLDETQLAKLTQPASEAREPNPDVEAPAEVLEFLKQPDPSTTALADAVPPREPGDEETLFPGEEEATDVDSE